MATLGSRSGFSVPVRIGGPDVVVKCHHAAGLEELERQNGIAKDIDRLVTGVHANEIKLRRVFGN